MATIDYLDAYTTMYVFSWPLKCRVHSIDI